MKNDVVGDALLEYADFYDYRPSYPDYDPDKGVETDMEVECSSKSSQGHSCMGQVEGRQQ